MPAIRLTLQPGVQILEQVAIPRRDSEQRGNLRSTTLGRPGGIIGQHLELLQPQRETFMVSFERAVRLREQAQRLGSAVFRPQSARQRHHAGQ
jgi:hypothetical protein